MVRNLNLREVLAPQSKECDCPVIPQYPLTIREIRDKIDLKGYGHNFGTPEVSDGEVSAMG